MTEWEYLPGCRCDRCEDERKASGMTLVNGFMTPRDPSREHQWHRQRSNE